MAPRKFKDLFVLSVEGPAYVDKGTWATHKALAVSQTKQGLIKKVRDNEFKVQPSDDTILLITNLATGETERVEAV